MKKDKWKRNSKLKKTKRKIPHRKWCEVSNNLKIINTCTENCAHEFRSLAWFIDPFLFEFIFFFFFFVSPRKPNVQTPQCFCCCCRFFFETITAHSTLYPARILYVLVFGIVAPQFKMTTKRYCGFPMMDGWWRTMTIQFE